MLDYHSPSMNPWKAHLQGLVLRFLRGCEDAIEATRRRLVPAPVTLFRDVTAPWLASALCVAARLRLSDILGEEPMPVEVLAERVDVGLPELRRILATLSAHGYFALTAEGVVGQTPLSRALSRRVAGSFAELQGRRWYRQAFYSGHVLQGWREGRTPFEVATKRHFFDYLEEFPAAGDLFLDAMADVTRFCTPFLASEIRLGRQEKVLDVGGGDGELARALALRFPSNTMAVLDRAVTENSRSGEASNYRFHQGDFFQAVPTGYNHLFLKNILHDWDDQKSLEILSRCREAVGVGARLTVIECLLPESGQSRVEFADTFALDWNVWLTLSGRERPASAYFALMERTGWRAKGVTPTATPYSLLEAVAHE